MGKYIAILFTVFLTLGVVGCSGGGGSGDGTAGGGNSNTGQLPGTLAPVYSIQPDITLSVASCTDTAN